jgi:hypothetical protein
MCTSVGSKSVLDSLFLRPEEGRTLNIVTLGRGATLGNSPRKAHRKAIRPSLYRPCGESEVRAASSEGLSGKKSLALRRYEFDHSGSFS